MSDKGTGDHVVTSPTLGRHSTLVVSPKIAAERAKSLATLRDTIKLAREHRLAMQRVGEVDLTTHKTHDEDEDALADELNSVVTALVKTQVHRPNLNPYHIPLTRSTTVFH